MSAMLLQRWRPFDRLTPERAAAMAPLLESRHYQLGQTVLRPDRQTDGLLLVQEGRLRSLAIDPINGELHTLELLEPGDTAGWSSLLRQAPCEQLRAASATTVLLLPAADFQQLLEQEPALRDWYACHGSAAELHQLLEALGQPSVEPLLSQQDWHLRHRQRENPGCGCWGCRLPSRPAPTQRRPGSRPTRRSGCGSGSRRTAPPTQSCRFRHRSRRGPWCYGRRAAPAPSRSNCAWPWPITSTCRSTAMPSATGWTLCCASNRG